MILTRFCSQAEYEKYINFLFMKSSGQRLEKSIKAFAILRTIGEHKREPICMYPIEAMSGSSVDEQRRNALEIARQRMMTLAFDIGFMVRDAVSERIGENAVTFSVTGGDGTQAVLRIEVEEVCATP